MKHLTALQGEAALKGAAPLFASWEETLIWTALEGRMGKIWVCQTAEPPAALCRTGAFIFLAGAVASCDGQLLLAELETLLQGHFAILVPQNDAWSTAIAQHYGQRAKAGERYAIRKEPDCFDLEKLQVLSQQLPPAVSLSLLTGDWYSQALAQEWSVDFSSQFGSQEAYERDGLGVVAIAGGEIIGGASSYIRYSQGIEIEVQTRKDYRRQGIATACCYRLKQESLKRG